MVIVYVLIGKPMLASAVAFVAFRFPTIIDVRSLSLLIVVAGSRTTGDGYRFEEDTNDQIRQLG